MRRRKRFLRHWRLSILVVLFIFISNTSGTISADTLNTTFYFPLIFKQEAPRWLGPDGGTIVTVVFNPDTPSIVYAGTWGAGVFISQDGGEHWSQSSNGLGNLYINSMTIDPQNPDILYAGTYQGGIYKSSDGGKTWSYASNGIQNDAIIYAIEVTPDNPKVVYAATRGPSNGGNPPWKGIIYKSTNRGGKWTPILQNLGGSNIQDWAYDLEIHPKQTNYIYAATHEHGILRSTDNGKTWYAINTGITDYSARAIGIDPKTWLPATVYLGVWKKTGVFKSTNSGDYWVLKDNGLKEEQIFRLVVDPKDPDNIYLATYTHGVIKTTNGGDKWTRAGLTNNLIASLAIHPSNPNILFAGTESEGLHKTSNSANSWSLSQQGLNATWVSSLLFHPENPDQLFAGMFGGGVATSINKGNTWTAFDTNLSDSFIRKLVSDPNNPQIIYALTNSEGLFRCDLTASPCWSRYGDNLPSSLTPLMGFSTDPSAPLWHQVYDPAGTMEQAFAIQSPTIIKKPLLSMAFDPVNPNLAYLGISEEGIYRTTDGGNTWSYLGLSGQSVWDIHVHPENPNCLYAAITPQNGVWQSCDSGNSWSRIGLDTLTVHTLTQDPAEINGLYAGTSNGVYHFSGGVWLAQGLTGTNITALVVHPVNTWIFIAGTNNGVYISHDRGATWEQGPDMLRGLSVTDITFDPQAPNVVYYSTSTRGILKAILH